MANEKPDGGSPFSGRNNFLWLVADKGLRLLAGVAVGVLVARHLGPGRYGLFAYAASIVAVLMPLAELGVEAVVRRKLIMEPESAACWLGLVWRARLGSAVLLNALVAGWLAFFHGPSEDTALILILSITLFQPAGMTADMWLQANLRARQATMASWLALLAGAVSRLWLVGEDADLTAYAWVAAGEGALNCVFVRLAARRSGMPRRAGDFAPVVSLRVLMAESWPLLLAGLTVMLYMRLDMVMLRSLSGERAAGIYAAAVRLSELWYFLPGALASSILPGLLRRKAESSAAYGEAMRRYYDLNAAMAYVAAAGTFLAAEPLVRLAYGAEFTESAAVLRCHAWSVVFVFLGVARSQYLVNEGMAAFHLATTAAGAALNIALNFWLIPAHGPIGAAWATLASYGVAAWGASWLHPRARATAALQTRALLVPLLGWRYLRF
ncbi:MAG: hypothetical protein RLZZ50_1602 [Verrucomicrobiota bacterium]